MATTLRAILAALVVVSAVSAQTPLVQRGPYLQMGTPDGIVIRWRTDLATDSVVTYGTSFGMLNQVATDPAPTTEHVVTLTGLTPSTDYYYAVGSTLDGVLAGGGPATRFRTAPLVGSKARTHFWVVGDSGTANATARQVRDGYYLSTGNRHTDFWLMLGDNAYDSGTDVEYQTAVFQNMYEDMLQSSVLWPAIGNHDAGSADSPTESGPYYDIFTMPRMGEAGGVPSGTEAYYSFDWANVHFICLDSMDTDRSVNGAMALWLTADLAATTQDWIIAYWHHPPYSKGSHDSDVEGRQVQMRENFLPILEAGGVDLVLAGHSHSYERSMLIDGHYDLSTTFNPATMVKDGGNGVIGSSGAYAKPTSGANAHEGAVYVVAGASGALGGGTFDHPVMLVNLVILGSLAIDVQDQQLDLQYIDRSGAIVDSFTMVKGGVTPVQTNYLPIAPLGNWKYEDSGTDLGTSWRDRTFPDAAWSQGPAILGFGEVYLSTIVNSGPANAVHPTTYFRRHFNLTIPPESVESLAVGAIYDDGYVAYLNGVEIARSPSMGTGTVVHSTLASAHEATVYEPRQVDLPPGLLVSGDNVLAFEVHQDSATSSDLVFDAFLYIAARPSYLSAPAEGTYTFMGEKMDLLEVNDSSGGFGRSVNIGFSSPITVALRQPPSNPIPANFSLFGTFGTSYPTDVYVLPFNLGSLCFPPSVLGPMAAPFSFLLADTYGIPGALAPSNPTPWTITNPTGFAFPLQLTLQGWIEKTPGSIALTNAVRLNIVP